MTMENNQPIPLTTGCCVFSLACIYICKYTLHYFKMYVCLCVSVLITIILCNQFFHEIIKGFRHFCQLTGITGILDDMPVSLGFIN